MILNINGNINRYYVQTLCMVFFPGATFGLDEKPCDGVPVMTVDVSRDEDSASVSAYVSIQLNDKLCEATETVSLFEEITIANHESIAVGRAVFAAGKALLGHTPPWGILTGVRPGKVAAGILATGKGVIKTKRVLRDEYFLTPPKAALAVSVASSEMKLAKNLTENSCSLYISIPFCPTRCAYCSFVSYTTKRLLSMIDEYLDALICDLEHTLKMIKELKMTVNTVYIGGGTPTILSAEQLARIFEKLHEYIDVNELLEFTLEAGRPDTITADKLSCAKENGVTRISVNPQTLSDSLLSDIGRAHTVEDFYNAYSRNTVFFCAA